MSDNFWAYIHENESGDLTDDLGNFTEMADAIDELMSNMKYNLQSWFDTHTGRVVSLHDSRTVWIAGTMEHIALGEHLGVRDDNTEYLMREREAYLTGAIDVPYGITPPRPARPNVWTPDDGMDEMDALFSFAGNTGPVDLREDA